MRVEEPPYRRQPCVTCTRVRCPLQRPPYVSRLPTHWQMERWKRQFLGREYARQAREHGLVESWREWAMRFGAVSLGGLTVGLFLVGSWAWMQVVGVWPW